MLKHKRNKTNSYCTLCYDSYYQIQFDTIKAILLSDIKQVIVDFFSKPF